MADRVAEIERQAVTDGYHRTSQNAQVEAEALDLAARAVAALTDPHLETRLEIFNRMQEMHGDNPVTDRQTELGLEQGLGRAVALLKTKAESAGRIAISASQTEEFSEQSGPLETGY